MTETAAKKHHGGAQEKPFDDFTCRAKILNSAQGTTITKTLCTFTYDDGSTSSDPSNGDPGDVNIGFGDAGYRYSQDKCVVSCYCFILTDNAGSLDSTANAPSGYCLIAPQFELTPKTAVSKAELVAKQKQRQKPHLVLYNGISII
jgi:hypothetical protein